MEDGVGPLKVRTAIQRNKHLHQDLRHLKLGYSERQFNLCRSCEARI